MSRFTVIIISACTSKLAPVMAIGCLVLFISCKKNEIPPPAENEIYLMYKMFSPQQLTVKKGKEVIFTNRDNANHSATSNAGVFNSGKLKTDKSYSYTFDKAGTYYFYCNYHSSNVQENGVITVE
ncbi:hypothetical protein CNR22_03015 [Sphingobacteriaceae bacterium]|nr:hypothetical protein CNR22_03015 [Sphingobacteriaceae bacterium]